MTVAGETVSTITDVRIPGFLTSVLTDEPVDVLLQGDVIADIAPRGNLRPRGVVLEGSGGWLVPGLWDHHVHPAQWSLTSERTPVDHSESAAHAARLMGDAPTLSDGRRVGVGFRDALWADAPTIEMLDATTGEVPTYLINADLHSIWLNSAARRREGLPADGPAMLREGPAFEISLRLNDIDPARSDELVARAAAAAAARGVVGMVDLDMVWNEESWMRRLESGFDALRVEFGIYPAFFERALAAGLRTGDLLRGEASDLVRVGSLKLITDGSLGTRTASCSHAYPDDPHNFGLLTVEPAILTEMMSIATGAGLSCAVHAIGDVANRHALDSFARTGATGTIEHAQLVAHADIPRFARLGVGASVQPEHAMDDRDIVDVAWASQTALPYPLRALADSGATLLLGSDAPVSPLDPWVAMAAAVGRSRDGREPWHAEESIDIATALAASTHHGSGDRAAVIEPGESADLVVVAENPGSMSPDELRRMPVLATMIAGRLTHVAL